MNAFTPFIQAIGRGEKLQRDLTCAEAEEAMRQILAGEATPAQVGALLITQRVKEETADEIVGFTVAARAFCQRISPRVEGLIDLGIPYDGKSKTLQLAPLAALVAAAAGQPIVFHGDRNVPTKCGVGPADLLKALGVPVDLSPALVQRQIETIGIGFLYAPRFAPAWHALTPIRHEFGLRTALNTIEKLLNPANAPIQVACFFHMNYLQRMREALRRLNAESWLIQGVEGSLECTPGRATRLLSADAEAEPLQIHARGSGLAEDGDINAPPDPQIHAAIARKVLANEPGIARDTVVLTAGMLLFIGHRVATLSEGIALAQETLASGAAQRRLQRWRATAVEFCWQGKDLNMPAPASILQS